MNLKSGAKPARPNKRSNSSLEDNKLIVLICGRFPLNFQGVENLLFEGSIDVCYEAVRFFKNQFGKTFGMGSKRQRINRISGLRQWRCHLNDMLFRID